MSGIHVDHVTGKIATLSGRFRCFSGTCVLTSDGDLLYDTGG